MAPTSFPHSPHPASATAAFLHGVQKLKYSSVLIFQTIRVGRSEFRTLLVRTYAASLDTLRGAEIDYRPVNVGPADKRAVVKGLVKRPGMQPLTMEMAVERQPDGWHVIDIAIENLSLVTNYRTEFGGIVQRDGLNGLIKSLAERNAPRDAATAAK
jgi:phospholipid transport system substrate-binding protein